MKSATAALAGPRASQSRDATGKGNENRESLHLREAPADARADTSREGQPAIKSPVSIPCTIGIEIPEPAAIARAWLRICDVGNAQVRIHAHRGVAFRLG